MHTVLAPFVAVFAALTSVSSALSAQFDQLIGHRLGMFGIAAIVVTSLAIAVGCAAWALLERARRGSYYQRVQAVLRRSQVARHFRDSILESLPETVVILRSRSQQALSYGGGSALLQRCLSGPDAAPLAVAIDDLLKHASGFSLSVRLSGLRQVFVRGRRIGNGAALFLRSQENYRANETVGTRRLLPAATPLGGEPGPGPKEDTGDDDNVLPIRASRDGEIVIGTDGRVKHYNHAFAQQWSLRADELRGEPLWTAVVERCIGRNGRDTFWDIVSCATTTAEPEQLNNWGAVTRANGKQILLSFLRLEDGATRVTFADALPLEVPPPTAVAM